VASPRVVKRILDMLPMLAVDGWTYSARAADAIDDSANPQE
jgi:hypothetical protein